MGVSISIVDTNGSALRSAMDGNFTPLIDALPVNASQKASALASINSAESSLLLASLFGNRDGTVEPSEVSLFESLLRDEASAIPSGALTGGSFLSTTLNGNAPGSASFGGATFSGAPGADSSPAPITVTTSSTESFLPDGSSGSLVVSWNLTIAAGIALPAPNATVTVTTPAATTITTATGLQGESVHNDLLGYGAPSASGSIGAGATGSATVAFHPAFPLGDVLIIAGIGVVVGVLALLYRRRLRRAREVPDAARS
ncbi:MAG: hypothetical protein L3K18_00095 [Thermoplasmata archaeon]|nr:hypothetical protein [Thermoplasmata archaeon]MCI4355532.1 hypothetical protein [Thermoplasmata archaeon]